MEKELMFCAQLIDRKSSFMNDLNSYRKIIEKPQLDDVYNPLQTDRNLLHFNRHAKIHNLKVRTTISRKRTLRFASEFNINNDVNNFYFPPNLNIKEYLTKLVPKTRFNDITAINNDVNNFYFSPDLNIKEYITNLEPKTRFNDITTLYNTHDELTDKKVLGTITHEEEVQLEKIRDKLESHNNEDNFVNFYEKKIDQYQELLEQIKELKQILKK